jgi:hypothetical protein
MSLRNRNSAVMGSAAAAAAKHERSTTEAEFGVGALYF